jgi:hypothetical protein
MRQSIFVLAVALASSAADGGSDYDRGSSQAPAPNQQWSYFCRSDAHDGRYFITRPRPAFQGKNDGTHDAKYSAAWTTYLSNTYGAKNISYPQCAVMASNLIDASYKSFVDDAARLHRHTVDVDWQYDASKPSP